MTPTLKALVAGALGSAFLLGCQSANVRDKWLNDPLLLSKRPAEKKPDAAETQLLARAEPAAPALPQTALAAATKPKDAPVPKDAAKEDVAAEPPPMEKHADPPELKEIIKGLPKATAVSTPVASNGPPASLAVRRTVAGTYGRAPDYSWLQGVLERRYDGRLELRFCDPSVADELGGKVTLVDDPRLGEFHEGDIIQVEGDLSSESGTASKSGWHTYPLYRIRQAWSVPR
jgi:hypothetical protein